MSEPVSNNVQGLLSEARRIASSDPSTALNMVMRAVSLQQGPQAVMEHLNRAKRANKHQLDAIRRHMMAKQGDAGLGNSGSSADTQGNQGLGNSGSSADTQGNQGLGNSGSSAGTVQGNVGLSSRTAELRDGHLGALMSGLSVNQGLNRGIPSATPTPINPSPSSEPSLFWSESATTPSKTSFPGFSTHHTDPVARHVLGAVGPRGDFSCSGEESLSSGERRRRGWKKRPRPPQQLDSSLRGGVKAARVGMAEKARRMRVSRGVGVGVGASGVGVGVSASGGGARGGGGGARGGDGGGQPTNPSPALAPAPSSPTSGANAAFFSRHYRMGQDRPRCDDDDNISLAMCSAEAVQDGGDWEGAAGGLWVRGGGDVPSDTSLRFHHPHRSSQDLAQLLMNEEESPSRPRARSKGGGAPLRREMAGLKGAAYRRSSATSAPRFARRDSGMGGTDSVFDNLSVMAGPGSMYGVLADDGAPGQRCRPLKSLLLAASPAPAGPSHSHESSGMRTSQMRSGGDAVDLGLSSAGVLGSGYGLAGQGDVNVPSPAMAGSPSHRRKGGRAPMGSANGGKQPNHSNETKKRTSREKSSFLVDEELIKQDILSGNSEVCPMCNGIVTKRRMPAHLRHWCPMMGDGGRDDSEAEVDAVPMDDAG